MKRSLGAIIILLVFGGILLLVAKNGPTADSTDRQSKSTDSTMNLNTFFGGVEGRNTSASFKGGSVSAVMGGIDLDLRDAVMEGNEATLKISAIMGGVDIRVPSSWTVVNRIRPIFGGSDNNTRSGDGTKRLILEGSVIMGGLDIKN